MRFAAPLTCAVVLLNSSLVADEPNAPEGDLHTRVAALEAEVNGLSRQLSALRSQRQDGHCKRNEIGQLNGRWRYMLSTERDSTTQYDDGVTELVIAGNRWTVLVNGNPRLAQLVEYDLDTTPASLVRRAPDWASNSVARAIFKVDQHHLIYTTTPLENPSTLDSNLALPNGEPLIPEVPDSFDPKGTANTEYILRRVGSSTKIPPTAANQTVNPSGGSDDY
ncbi:hypothetical protein SH528x_003011 [Novipirellula sp. SH528]|uniref:hypothetical protein n=1 Tax=Novipirellula sp. SH528 TaxID=3454466 RepID=UPI003F9FF409